MVVDVAASVAVLNQLQELGIKIAIDDFGTGYSSLRQLHVLPIDQMKIDRSFISNLTADDSASAIVRASINLARELKIITVAEGVEDEMILRIVRDLGCHEVQGYVVSKPIPAFDLVRWANEWSPDEFRKRLNDPHKQVPAIAHA